MAEKKPKKQQAAKSPAPELEDVATLVDEVGTVPATDCADARIAQLEAEKQLLGDQLLRVAAEYDNFRKRSAKEKDALYGEAVCDAVCAVLPVIDNLERAAAYGSGDPVALAEGVNMTLKSFFESLGRLGLKEVDTSGPFDPALHNAVMHVEDESLPENSIAEVLQKGYMVGDRILRHAMVKVAN